ncbi:PASTA domain-containing protein [Nonomuraea terrae]|uniref:PASTA domain-containing protein n=1 Tax=Nonomuraea terrae TaxID=2530383 RepID=UPI003793CF50
MSKLKVAAGAIVGLIAVGALVDACDDPWGRRWQGDSAVTATPTTAASSAPALPPDAARFYAKHKTMPNVSGRTLAQLTKLLRPVRDTVLVARTADNTMPVGTEKVTKQLPKAGAKLAAGQQVKIWIRYGTKRPTPAGVTARPDVNVPDRDSNRNRGESRFCSGRWWC